MKTYLPLIFACAQFGVFAQSVSTNRLTPELVNQLAEEARTNNAALWAARARISAAQHNAASIQIWRDPEVMIGGMAAERMMREEDGDLMYGVEQMLPVFGKEKAARAAARKEVEVEEAELDFRFQTLRRDLAAALFKAALADEALAISREDLAWLETLTAAVEQRYAAGTGSQVELLRARNERSRRAELVRNEENNREDAYVTVNRLLNRNVYSAWARLELPPVAEPLPIADRLVELAIKFAPELQRMRKDSEAAEAMAAATKKESRPDLSAAVEGRQYTRTGEGRSASVLLRMSIPLFNRSKYRSAVKRDEAKIEEIQSLLEDASHQVAAEVHHLMARIDNARREALLYANDIIPRTELTLSSAEAMWRAGGEGLRDVIETRRMLTEGRLMRARAVAEQYMSLYELVLCCGLADLETIQSMLTKEAAQ